MPKEVIIIGGGIIGLCSAYYLQKEGCKVTVIDKSDMKGLDGGASFVNAGFITPSHIIPLASPGMMVKGLKWMFNSSSPFYMKPRLDTDFIKWLWYYNKSATTTKVKEAIPLIKEINVFSRELYQEIFDSGDLGSFQWERKGLLMLYKTEKAGDEEWQVAQWAKKEGLDVKSLDLSELAKIEPHVELDVKGAIHYECDAHTTPDEFMPKIISYLKSQGVVFKTNEAVINISADSSKISKIQTTKTIYTTDEVIMAAGSWSRDLAKSLQLNIPVEAGKGYRINIMRQTGIQLPSILMEAKVAVTPMNGFTRFAGTMEFSGINHKIRKERVMSIANAAQQFYKGLSIDQEEIDAAQCGLRPCSPDGLPLIGRTNTYKNLTIATGHAMMGWSLGPATGKLVSEIIMSCKLSLKIGPYQPERRF